MQLGHIKNVTDDNPHPCQSVCPWWKCLNIRRLARLPYYVSSIRFIYNLNFLWSSSNQPKTTNNQVLSSSSASSLIFFRAFSSLWRIRILRFARHFRNSCRRSIRHLSRWVGQWQSNCQTRSTKSIRKQQSTTTTWWLSMCRPWRVGHRLSKTPSRRRVRSSCRRGQHWLKSSCGGVEMPVCRLWTSSWCTPR